MISAGIVRRGGLQEPEGISKMPGITREEAKECVGAGWANLLDVIYDRLPADTVVV